MVNSTRKGIAFSDVLTRADTSRPRHIEATASTAMPRITSMSGAPVRKAPWAGNCRQDTPISTSNVDCRMLMTPRTSSLETRYAPDDRPAARSRVRIERSLTSSRTELAMPARHAQMTRMSSRVPASRFFPGAPPRPCAAGT